MVRSILAVFTALLFLVSFSQAQTIIDIFGPPGSGQFGKEVKALPNGNFVVTNPGWDNGATQNVGAVHLYNGASGALISTMTGLVANDQVGSGGITILPNGDFLVRSPLWDTPQAVDSSAITRCSGTTGCPATVTSQNSLCGLHSGDNIGSSIVVLSNGSYVVASPTWDNGGNADAGAATWCSESTGCPAGAISSSNSLVGGRSNDKVAEQVLALPTGNYVVKSPLWENGAATVDAGAVTFGSGTTGVKGLITPTNSLVGGQGGDQIGSAGVFVLPSGLYVVASPSWNNLNTVNVGAVTVGSGTTGVTGPATVTNSLVGTTANDEVGDGVTVLSNGNYVVTSPFSNNGAIGDAGAATWCDGNTGLTGPVTAANSLTGTSFNDYVGDQGAVALTNGNYVVMSFFWTNSTGGAVGGSTWGNGATGTTGPMTPANSLVGTRYMFGDLGVGTGSGITPLTNGNYVVRSPLWNNGASNQAGAATLCPGDGPCAAVISNLNSLVGTSNGDQVSRWGVTALAGGNYVVRSVYWTKDGQFPDAGAVTWGNGTTGVTGPVSASNSLIGSGSFDRVGSGGITPLTNGNYVVDSWDWRNQGLVNAGAVTWGNGTSGVSGEINSGNSLVGMVADQATGLGGVTALKNGNYVVGTPQWSNGAVSRVGALTWANGATGITGTITGANSLVGSTANDRVGEFLSVTALEDGNYMVKSSEWDNGPIGIAGAMTRCNGTVGTRGTINSQNSVVGITDGGGHLFNFTFDAVNNQFIVGHPQDNTATLYRMVAAGSVSGRVADANGAPIRNAIMTLVAPGGQRFTGQTGQLGVYFIDNVPTGGPYTVIISAKRYRFSPTQPLFIDGNIADYNFSARSQEF